MWAQLIKVRLKPGKDLAEAAGTTRKISAKSSSRNNYYCHY